MVLRRVILAFLLVALVTSSWAFPPGPMSYVAQQSDGGAVLELDQGRTVIVHQGDEVPGVGSVESIDDRHLTISRTLSGDERTALKAKGAFAPA